MMMKISERYKQRLLDNNVILNINNKYLFVTRDLTEFGLLITSLSDEYESLEEALNEYSIMRRKFNKKFREFRHKISLLNVVASDPHFFNRKNKYYYNIHTISEKKSKCLRFGSFNSMQEAENHYLNNRISILKRIIGDDYE